MKKSLSVALVAALLCVTISGVWAGGGKEAGGVAKAKPIVMWHTYTGSSPQAQAFAAEFNKFKAANPDVVLEVDEVNSAMDSMGNRIATAMAADDLPDVWSYWGGFVITNPVKQGLLMNMQEYLDKTTSFKKGNIEDAAWEYYTIDGVIRGLPFEGYYPAWFCNKEIFEKYGLDYPKTMQDVMAISKVLASKGVIPIAVGSSGGNPGHFMVSDLTHQYPGGTADIVNFGKTNKFNTPATLKAAQTIRTLRAAGAFPKDTVANGDWLPSFELYNSGLAAMLYSYTFAFSGMSDEMFNKSVLIDAPKEDGATVDPKSFVQFSANYGFVASQKAWSDTGKQAGMVKLFDFLMSHDLAQSLGDANVVQVQKGITYNGKILKSVDAFYKGRNRAPGHFNTCSNMDGWSVILSSCDELFSGSITAEQFVEKVQKAFDSVQ